MRTPHWVAPEIESLLDRCLERFEAVVRVYDEVPSLQGLTVTTGYVSQELAAQHSAGGHVGRASGKAFDTRKSYPYAPYHLDIGVVLRTEGNVDARVWVRIEEGAASGDHRLG